MTGLYVARSVVVEFLTERESVYLQNVHMLILHTTSAMVVVMKRRNVMKNVVQVCLSNMRYNVSFVKYLNRKTILGSLG